MNQPASNPGKPVPVVSPWAQPFWDATDEHRLVVQHCDDCQQRIFYPRIACPFCSSDNVSWVQVSGRGTIYSFTIVESNSPSAFFDDLPYVVAVIRLEEGVQMLSNIIDCDQSTLRCDMPVEVTFEKLNDDFTLPKFRPILD